MTECGERNRRAQKSGVSSEAPRLFCSTRSSLSRVPSRCLLLSQVNCLAHGRPLSVLITDRFDGAAFPPLSNPLRPFPFHLKTLLFSAGNGSADLWARIFLQPRYSFGTAAAWKSRLIARSFASAFSRRSFPLVFDLIGPRKRVLRPLDEAEDVILKMWKIPRGTNMSRHDGDMKDVI